MIIGHKIKKKLEVDEFLDLMENFREKDIYITHHTLFRLRQKDRKIFKDKLIKDYLLIQRPLLVGIQNNGNHSVFYEHGRYALRIVIDIQTIRINVVTFYMIDNNKIPKI